MKERLEILGEEDLGDDPLDVDVVREYSFVIYDQVRVLDYMCVRCGFVFAILPVLIFFHPIHSN